MGCPPTVINQLSCLQNLAVKKLFDQKYEKPWINHDYSSSDPFIPNYSKNVVKAGNYNTTLKIIMGFTQDEGLYFTGLLHGFPPARKYFKAIWHTADGPLASVTPPHFRDKLTNLTNHYIGSIDNMDNPAYLPQLTNLFTDTFFWIGGHKVIARHVCGDIAANMPGTLYLLTAMMVRALGIWV